MTRPNTMLTWAAVLAVLLALLNLPLPLARRAKAAVREALAPLDALLSGAALRAREAGRTVRGLGGLASENRALAEETLRLRMKVRELEAREEENLELRRQLGFARAARHPLVPCEVIARDVSGWWETLRLNRGARDGVTVDLPVVTAEGLAGRTVDASTRTADVLLMSDPNCRVSARVVRTGAFGVVSGRGVRANGQVLCRMEFINRNLPARPGDEVVTSGLGGVFPPGLPIGYVERVERAPSGLYEEADVLPRADLGRMRYAFVLRRGPAAGDAAAPPEAGEAAP